MSPVKTILSLSLLTGVMLSPIHAQTKPAESTSKVKKVFLYNKIGGWVHTDGRRDVTAVMTKLAAAKGFALTVSEDDASITLAYLKQFNVIIWDNNTNGAGSVPNLAARQAVLDYVNQGGGWVLIHGAGDHGNTWVALKDALGTTFTTHGSQGQADAVLDPAATKHKELKWMVEGLPAKARLHDEWYSFQNTVRPLPGVTVVFTATNGASGVLKPLADGSNDHVYLWNREIGKGRMFYTAIGHGGNELFSQADSFSTKMLWQNVRYAAGDFQNGCTNPNSTNYDAAARVNDGTCASSSLPGRQGQGGTASGVSLVQGGRKTFLTFPHDGMYSMELRDIRGSVVWSRSLESRTEISLDGAVPPGIYQLVARSGKSVAKQRLALY